MNKKNLYKAVFFAVFGLIVGGSCYLYFRNDLPSVNETTDGIFVSASNTAQLQRFFKKAGYDMLPHLKDKKPVPRIFVKSVPKDFNKEKYDEVRPALFYEIMTPIILKANSIIRKWHED